MFILRLLMGAEVQKISRSSAEDDDRSVERELEEGNFGLKIKPPVLQSATPRVDETSKSDTNEEPPQKEYGPPREPIAKISDVLTGHGPTFPDVIEKHLYSPVPVYRSRLGSPTPFEIPQSVPSQFRYSEQKLYTENMNEENLKRLKQNSQESLSVQQEQGPIPLNDFLGVQSTTPQTTLSNDFIPLLNEDIDILPQPPIIWQFQGASAPLDTFHSISHTTTSKTFANEFVSRSNTQKFDPMLDLSHQVYHNFFSTRPNDGPQDIYQQINQLETSSETQATYKMIDQSAINEYKKNVIFENIENQNSSSEATQAQAVSYARFSQRLPTPLNEKSEKETIQPSIFPSQEQQLPQVQAPPLFQPISFQLTAQSGSTSPRPATTLFTTTESPRRIGIIRIRQLTTMPYRTTRNQEPTFSPTTSYIITTTSKPPGTFKKPITETLFSTTNTPSQNPDFPPHFTLAKNNIDVSEMRSTLPSISTLPKFSTTQSSPTTDLPETPSTLLFTSVKPILTTISPIHLEPLKILSSQSENKSSQEKPLAQEELVVKDENEEIDQTLQLFNQHQLLQEIQSIDIPQQLDLSQHFPHIQIISQQQEFVQIPQSQKLLEIVQQPIPHQIDLVEHNHAVVHPKLIKQFSPLQLLSQSDQLEQQLNQPQFQHIELLQNKTEMNNKTDLNQQEKPRKQNPNTGTSSLENTPQEPERENLNSQLLKNALFSEEERLYFVQPPYLPVPVGFGAVPTSVLDDPSSSLYAASLTQDVSPYHAHTYQQSPTALSALHYYGNYAPDIFRDFR